MEEEIHPLKTSLDNDGVQQTKIRPLCIKYGHNKIQLWMTGGATHAILNKEINMKLHLPMVYYLQGLQAKKYHSKIKDDSILVICNNEKEEVFEQQTQLFFLDQELTRSVSYQNESTLKIQKELLEKGKFK